MEVGSAETVYIGDCLYSGVGNWTHAENERWQARNTWSRGFCLVGLGFLFACLLLQQDRSAHNLIICLVIIT